MDQTHLSVDQGIGALTLFAPLPAGPFDVLYADPPWSYRGRKQFGFAGDVGVDTGGAVQHYRTLSVGQIASLGVEQICADDCLCFLWVPSPLLPDGMTVLAAWGFGFATVGFVWDKERVNPGYYTLSQCELCIVGKRGRIPQPRGSRRQRQLIRETRGRHSAKPREARLRITRMFPTQRKIELFARAKVVGWSAWGDQLEAVR